MLLYSGLISIKTYEVNRCIHVHSSVQIGKNKQCVTIGRLYMVELNVQNVWLITA